MRHLLLMAVLVMLLSSVVIAQTPQVRFNEFDTGAVDYIEICNFDANTVDISGWSILYFEDTQVPLGVSFTFPGAPNSATVLINPNECVIVTDDQALAMPAVPMGTQIFWFGQNLLSNVGEPGSMLLADGLGNGVDYLAYGNPNMLLCPLEAGTFLNLGTGPGIAANPFTNPSPDNGLPNTVDIHIRHNRQDTDDGMDWTMRADMAASTPGTLNPFQIEIANATGLIPLAAAFTPNVTTGFLVPDLTVNFTNESVGEVELIQVTWDFDTANPGVSTSTKHNDSFTYTVPGMFDVTLCLIDPFGVAMSTPTTINVQNPPPAVPITTVPFVDDFEGMPDPITGLTATSANGWEFRLGGPTSRIQTVDPVSVGAAIGFEQATFSSGPTGIVMDSTTNGSFATNEVSLHFDALQTGDARLQYFLYENFDEVHPEDVIVIQDGVTMGDGIVSGGMTSGMPGRDGFMEVLLNDWNNVVADQTWTRFEHVIDSAFLMANGLTPTADMRIIFRQMDNFMFNGGDGLVIDQVRLLPPATPGNGQVCDPMNACMDINQSENANFNLVNTMGDPNGPFFASAIPGRQLTFTFQGEPNSPIILFTGPLNPAVVTGFNIGNIDIGNPLATTPFVQNIFSVANGTLAFQNPLNALFNTGPAGTATIQFTTPMLPPGIFGAFQAVIFNTQTVWRTTNAIEVSVP